MNSLLGDRVTIIGNPLYSKNSILKFSINSSSVGDSNHSISANSNGAFIKTNTITVEQLLASGVEPPDYIKVDVDGNEVDIILSSQAILANKKLKSILIELDLNNQIETSLMVDTLSGHGFREDARFDTMTKFDKVSDKKLFNFIFSRVS
jgi:hypothetical protein